MQLSMMLNNKFFSTSQLRKLSTSFLTDKLFMFQQLSIALQLMVKSFTSFFFEKRVSRISWVHYLLLSSRSEVEEKLLRMKEISEVSCCSSDLALEMEKFLYNWNFQLFRILFKEFCLWVNKFEKGERRVEHNANFNSYKYKIYPFILHIWHEFKHFPFLSFLTEENMSGGFVLFFFQQYYWLFLRRNKMAFYDEIDFP